MKIIPKNYGSIPHLSISKLSQQADKKINQAQEVILTQKARDWRDLIIVTEKIDGSNVGVIKKENEIIPITRSGYHANTSKYKQHILFSEFVERNKEMFAFLPSGWRICGEWCLMAHGTKMDITDDCPFVAFDIFNKKNKRIEYLHFRDLCTIHGIQMVPLVHIGQPISIKTVMELIGSGIYGKPEKPEGAVWRVERFGEVDFLAKYVRQDKEDGKYMKDDIWNVGYEKYL